MLSPKSGGIAFTLGTMGRYLDSVLDITIVYTPKCVSFWEFLCNGLGKITVHIDVLPVREDLIGDYRDDRQFRRHFQSWMNHLWRKKDALISKIRVSEGRSESCPASTEPASSKQKYD